MKTNYEFSSFLSLRYELDNQGKIVPNRTETEMDATELADELCNELEGLSFEDIKSGNIKLPYGIQLDGIDYETPDPQYERVA
jgi:hypothetical protein